VRRKLKEGTIDINRSLALARELAEIAGFHQDSNIMIDLKDTAGSMDTNELLQAALEFAHYISVFKNKIAVLMPIDEDRLARASIVHREMDNHGFKFNYFTDYEEAIEWLSIVVDYS